MSDPRPFFHRACSLGLGVFLAWWVWGATLSLGQTPLPETEGPAGKEPGASSGGPDSLLPPLHDTFGRAEALFQAGELDQARIHFNDFIRIHPQDPRAERALIRLGEIDFQQKSFASALRLFDFFLESHPGSRWVPQVQLFRARCFFELERWEEAEPLFKQALRNNPDNPQRWEALIYLGRMEALRDRPEQALDRLMQIVQGDGPADLKRLAETFIQQIIRERFNRSQLQALVQRLGKRFPADQALIRLIEIYRNQRALSEYQIALEDFVSRFPGHPESGAFREQLERFRQNPRRSVRIGAVLPLSGKRALIGQKVLQGIQLAFSRRHLLEKENIELVVVDSGLGRTVEEVVAELGEDPNIVGVIGPVLSEEVRQAAPLLERYGLAALTPTASSPGLAQVSPNVFRNALTREVQARYLADYAVNQLHRNRFVILFPKVPYGEEMTALFSDEVEAFGGTIVARIPYDREQNDFREQILQIGGIPDDQLKKIVLRHMQSGTQPPPLDDKGVFSRPVVEGGVFSEDEVDGLKVSLELNYDAIFIPGFYDKVGLIAPQLVFYNIENVQLLGASGWNSRELVENARNYLRSAIFVDGFFPDSRNPDVREFRTRFVNTFGEPPTALAAQAYDSANILLKLVREGATNRDKLLKALPGVENFPGVTGRTTLLASGEAEKQLVRLHLRGHRIVELE